MTIERSWWPSGDSPMDKFQASVLVSLAIEIDKITPPKHLDLQRSDEPAAGTQVRNWYFIGKKANSDTYRKYCEKLWERSSPSVKFLYLVSGLEPAINYIVRLCHQVARMKHHSDEVREDWDTVYMLTGLLQRNVDTIRQKATIDAVLGEAGSAEGLKTMFTEDSRLRSLMTKFEDHVVKLSPDQQETLGVINDKLGDVSGIRYSRRTGRYYRDRPTRLNAGDPCPDKSCKGVLELYAVCSEDCGWEIESPSPAYIRSVTHKDGVTCEPCPDCDEGHIHLAVECTECEADFITKLTPDQFAGDADGPQEGEARIDLDIPEDGDAD